MTTALVRAAFGVAVLATTLATLSASAAPILLARGALTGSSAGAGVDLSGQTGTLENGLTGNVFGGMGSAIAKTSFVDLVALLNANGVASNHIPSKIEGLAGQNVLLDGIVPHTLWIANDNDCVPGVAGPSLFYVVGSTDADLAGSAFVPQAVVPEPATVSPLFVGLAGLLGSTRRKRR